MPGTTPFPPIADPDSSARGGGRDARYFVASAETNLADDDRIVRQRRSHLTRIVVAVVQFCQVERRGGTAAVGRGAGRASFQRTHPQEVSDADEFYASVWQRIRDTLRLMDS